MSSFVGSAARWSWWLALAAALGACAGGGKAVSGLDGGDDGGVTCATNDDCNDFISCTQEFCGDAGVCEREADSTKCDDGTFCNGIEVCDLKLGCVPAIADACNDRNTCTIDACDEESRTCTHEARDLDGDGEVDWHCKGGTDCDDRDPLKSGGATEVCGDLKDNDCDGLVDEVPCGNPAGDTCDNPIQIPGSGSYVASPVAALRDYTLSCGASGGRDLVFTFTLTSPKDVDISTSASSLVTLALFDACPSAGEELKCNVGVPSRIRKRALPAGTYYVVVATFSTESVPVSLELSPPTATPTNETCASPMDLGAGGTVMGSFVDVRDDLGVSCAGGDGTDLVYRFTTTETRDLVVHAQSSLGYPLAVSIRADCEDGSSEARCTTGAPSSSRVYSAPAGTYYVLVEGPVGADVDFELSVGTEAPSAPPAGEACDNPIMLTEGVTAHGTLADKQNDHTLGCGLAYRDAVYAFTLDTPRDVVVNVQGKGAFVYAAIQGTCGDEDSELRCTNGTAPQLRLRAAAAGTYYVLVESFAGADFDVTYTTMDPVAPVAVSGNDTFAQAVEVPLTGGLYTGTTVGAQDDYQTDLCLNASGPDVVFRLDLPATRTVTLSTEGSTFDTVITVFYESSGVSTEFYCDDSSGPNDTSALSESMSAGRYYFVVDGFGSAKGAYDFRVTVAP